MRKTKRFLKTEYGKALLKSYPDSADKFIENNISYDKIILGI